MTECSSPDVKHWFTSVEKRQLRSVFTDKVITVPGVVFDNLYTYSDLTPILKHQDTFTVHRDPAIFDFHEENGIRILSANNQILMVTVWNLSYYEGVEISSLVLYEKVNVLFFLSFFVLINIL